MHQPEPQIPNRIVFSLVDGGEIVQTVHPCWGIGWTIRHARGVGEDKRVASWKVVRGVDCVAVAWSKNFF